MFSANTKKLFFLVYGVLIVVSSLGFHSKFYIPFYVAFSLFLGWLWFFGRVSLETTNNQGHKEDCLDSKKRGLLSHFYLILLIIALLTLIVSRLLPFLFATAPLGYDTGIYKKLIEIFIEALPNLPTQTIGVWSTSEWGMFLITDILSLFGFSSQVILYGYYILLNLLLGLGTYCVAKRFFNREWAICTLFIFAISATQLQAYWMMHYKNLVGLFLFLMAIWLLKRKSWLAVLVAGFLGGLHRATFLLFGLIMTAYFFMILPVKGLISLKRYLLGAGLMILCICLSLYVYNPQAIFQFISPNLGKMAENFGLTKQAAGGAFFSFNFYQQIVIFYLPFSLLGLLFLIQRRRFNYLFFWCLINFGLVAGELLFHNRFIVTLDFVLIVLAGISSLFIDYFFRSHIGRAALFIFLLSMLYAFVISAQVISPLISNEELAEIQSLARITEENAQIAAVSSYYSPWVYGFSQRKTIAPGLFEYNKWNLLKWRTFWTASNPELHHQFLDEYEKPLYIFTGDKAGKMDFSGDNAFVRISKRVWKYIGIQP